jgi:hypothetical protein
MWPAVPYLQWLLNYGAEYYPIDYTENYEPVYGSRPDYETYYEILIERRVITYKKPRKNS